MRTDCRYSLLALTAVFTATLACFAQSAGSVLTNGHSVSPGPRNDAPPLLNAPYTLTRKMSSVQRLANGTTITRNMTTKEAKDSSRRVYSEMHHMAPRLDEEQKDSVVYTLSDPQARTYLQWNSRSREAILTREPEPITLRTSARFAPQALATETLEHTQPQVTREDLGTRTIAGLEARGTCTTRVTPVGQEGNDAPLTFTTERWISTEYGITVLMVRDDPRSGTRTEEVTEFQLGEPDPALFQAPEGYTIREHVVGRSE
jgi:hypothetical protein